MLLNFPTELIQLVLWNCDPPAYLQAAFTSRRLFEIAYSNREIILHQLYQTPGLTDGLEALQTKALFSLLLNRSFAQLYGAEFYADRRVFDFQNRVIDSRASTLETSKDWDRVLLVFKGHSTVHLFRMEDGKLTLEDRFQPPGRHLGDIQVLRTAFDRDRGVYVLHRFKPFEDHNLDTNHPFVKHAQQSNSHGSIFLAYHDPTSETGVIRMCAFPDHEGYEPVAFSAHEDRFAISWFHTNKMNDREVVLYTIKQPGREEENEWDSGNESGASHITYVTYEPYVLAETNEEGSSDDMLSEKGLTVGLSFNDRGLQLLHHYRAQSLYGSFQRIHSVPLLGQHKPRLVENACIVSFSHQLSLRFSIGIPFFGTHETGDINQGVRCHWQYLALGIATHRVENWTVACLLKSQAHCQVRHCGHTLNLDRGRRFDNWEIMAQLGDFKELSTSPGSRVAASRQGTRIAVANWKTLYIWALEPQVLIEDNNNGFYPPAWRSPSSGILELRPAALQLDAVCSQMRFTQKEDELVLITDRGLMYLDLGPNGRGTQILDSHGHGIMEDNRP
ncbi:hypothetical protein NUU61_005603 [Penicillium alfredii]|uniref:F-box domain-containing protein n=1 Tax=Penicillium alfredii TaxID=1506179 RepID=A0A9W9FA73_9EURO|nr:uncharacterized protein NUU61_005603 [Penicillium alfredii]KAJ5096247.1 hypothetical protein NUU61_005603 [Penicillium alfredii]